MCDVYVRLCAYVCQWTLLYRTYDGENVNDDGDEDDDGDEGFQRQEDGLQDDLKFSQKVNCFYDSHSLQRAENTHNSGNLEWGGLFLDVLSLIKRANLSFHQSVRLSV